MTIAITPIPAQIVYVAPSLTLTTANAVGSAASAIRSDADVLAYDTTDPTTIAYAASAATGSAATAARRDHTHGMVGANLTLIATATASGAATLGIAGLTSDYDQYLVGLSDIVPQNNKDLRFRFGDSGGIDSGAGDYGYNVQINAEGATTHAALASGSNSFIALSGDVGNDGAGEGLAGLYVIPNPGDASMRPVLTGNTVYLTSGSAVTGGAVVGQRKAVITVSQIEVLFSTGLISGRMTVWGLAHD